MTTSEVTQSDQREETWQPIPGFSKYEAGDLGHVRGQVSGKLLAARVGTHGYLEVKPYDDDGKRQTRTVHSLVLLTFEGPRPAGMETLHGKGGPLDNRWPENIRYGTRPENDADRAAALAAAGRSGNGRPMPAPKPEKHCVRCDAVVTGNGRRCHPCVVAIGQEAAVLLRSGMSLGSAAEMLEYPSIDGLHTLAVKYGDYGAERPSLTRRVITTLRGRFSGGNAK